MKDTCWEIRLLRTIQKYITRYKNIGLRSKRIDSLWKQRAHKITKIENTVWLSLLICNTVVWILCGRLHVWFFNSIMVDSYSFLFNCTMVGRVSDYEGADLKLMLGVKPSFGPSSVQLMVFMPRLPVSEDIVMNPHPCFITVIWPILTEWILLDRFISYIRRLG